MTKTNTMISGRGVRMREPVLSAFDGKNIGVVKEPGLFGQMFPSLTENPLIVDDADLRQLADSHNPAFRSSSPRIFRADLRTLLNFSGLSGKIHGNLNHPDQLPSNLVIDWLRFFDLGTPANTPNFEFNHSRKLDPFITPQLHDLCGGTGLTSGIPVNSGGTTWIKS